MLFRKFTFLGGDDEDENKDKKKSQPSPAPQPSPQPKPQPKSSPTPTPQSSPPPQERNSSIISKMIESKYRGEVQERGPVPRPPPKPRKVTTAAKRKTRPTKPSRVVTVTITKQVPKTVTSTVTVTVPANITIPVYEEVDYEVTVTTQPPQWFIAQLKRYGKLGEAKQLGTSESLEETVKEIKGMLRETVKKASKEVEEAVKEVKAELEKSLTKPAILSKGGYTPLTPEATDTALGATMQALGAKTEPVWKEQLKKLYELKAKLIASADMWSPDTYHSLLNTLNQAIQAAKQGHALPADIISKLENIINSVEKVYTLSPAQKVGEEIAPVSVGAEELMGEMKEKYKKTVEEIKKKLEKGEHVEEKPLPAKARWAVSEALNVATLQPVLQGAQETATKLLEQASKEKDPLKKALLTAIAHGINISASVGTGVAYTAATVATGGLYAGVLAAQVADQLSYQLNPGERKVLMDALNQIKKDPQLSALLAEQVVGMAAGAAAGAAAVKALSRATAVTKVRTALADTLEKLAQKTGNVKYAELARKLKLGKAVEGLERVIKKMASKVKPSQAEIEAAEMRSAGLPAEVTKVGKGELVPEKTKIDVLSDITGSMKIRVAEEGKVVPKGATSKVVLKNAVSQLKKYYGGDEALAMKYLEAYIKAHGKEAEGVLKLLSDSSVDDAIKRAIAEAIKEGKKVSAELSKTEYIKLSPKAKKILQQLGVEVTSPEEELKVGTTVKILETRKVGTKTHVPKEFEGYVRTAYQIAEKSLTSNEIMKYLPDNIRKVPELRKLAVEVVRKAQTEGITYEEAMKEITSEKWVPTAYRKAVLEGLKKARQRGIYELATKHLKEIAKRNGWDERTVKALTDLAKKYEVEGLKGVARSESTLQIPELLEGSEVQPQVTPLAGRTTRVTVTEEVPAKSRLTRLLGKTEVKTKIYEVSEGKAIEGIKGRSALMVEVGKGGEGTYRAVQEIEIPPKIGAWLREKLADKLAEGAALNADDIIKAVEEGVKEGKIPKEQASRLIQKLQQLKAAGEKTRVITVKGGKTTAGGRTFGIPSGEPGAPGEEIPRLVLKQASKGAAAEAVTEAPKKIAPAPPRTIEYPLPTEGGITAPPAVLPIGAGQTLRQRKFGIPSGEVGAPGEEIPRIPLGKGRKVVTITKEVTVPLTVTIPADVIRPVIIERYGELPIDRYLTLLAIEKPVPVTKEVTVPLTLPVSADFILPTTKEVALAAHVDLPLTLLTVPVRKEKERQLVLTRTENIPKEVIIMTKKDIPYTGYVDLPLRLVEVVRPVPVTKEVEKTVEVLVPKDIIKEVPIEVPTTAYVDLERTPPPPPQPEETPPTVITIPVTVTKEQIITEEITVPIPQEKTEEVTIEVPLEQDYDALMIPVTQTVEQPITLDLDLTRVVWVDVDQLPQGQYYPPPAPVKVAAGPNFEAGLPIPTSTAIPYQELPSTYRRKSVKSQKEVVML